MDNHFGGCSAKKLKARLLLRKNQSHNSLLENPWKSGYEVGDSQKAVPVTNLRQLSNHRCLRSTLRRLWLTECTSGGWPKP
jgi:hypothetical protein